MPNLLRDTRHFYRDLPPLPGFAESVDSRRHLALPDDWWVLVADVVGSTQAIQAGHYKTVNTIGVACIAAVLNLDRDSEIPFVFGGDGATFALPKHLIAPVREALRGTQALAREQFGLTLRAGLIRAAELVQANFHLHLAKVRLSAHVTLAAFSGRGWEEAERRLKAATPQGIERIHETDGPARADFSGFECRWQAVPHFNGHKLSLLVAATCHDMEENLAIYRRIAQQLQHIYGDVANYHPLRAGALQLSLSPSELQAEWRVRGQGQRLRQRLTYLVKMLFQNLAGRYFFARQLDTKEVRWSGYRDELVDNSDFRKFDGMLRMVIDGSDEQAAALETLLEHDYRAGKLVYGLHKSDAALVTCLVQSYNGNHLHFVDGSDGGYALAARALKQRLLAWKSAG